MLLRNRKIQSVSSEVQYQTLDENSQDKKANELTILYDLYDLKAHSRIKCDDQLFTVSELLDLGWTIEQIVKQKYISLE